MASFVMTRGKVLDRELAAIRGVSREGRWAKGGGYMPKVTYAYVVDGVSYTSDRWGYAMEGITIRLIDTPLPRLPDATNSSL